MARRLESASGLMRGVGVSMGIDRGSKRDRVGGRHVQKKHCPKKIRCAKRASSIPKNLSRNPRVKYLLEKLSFSGGFNQRRTIA